MTQKDLFGINPVSFAMLYRAVEKNIDLQRTTSSIAVELYEQGIWPSDGAAPDWLGLPGFENLTQRFFAVLYEQAQGIETFALSPESSKASSESKGLSPERTKVTRSAIKKRPSRSVRRRAARRKAAKAAKKMETTKQDTSEEPPPNEADTIPSIERRTPISPELLRLLEASRKAKEEADYLTDETEEETEEKYDKYYLELLELHSPDDVEQVPRETRAEVEREAARWFMGTLQKTRKERVLLAHKEQLLMITEVLKNDAAYGGARSGEIISALEKLVGRKKGKGKSEKSESAPDIRGSEMADFVIWEVEGYLWALTVADEEIDDEVFEEASSLLDKISSAVEDVEAEDLDK